MAIWLVLLRSSFPAKDHHCCTRPATIYLGVTTPPPTAGPSCHLPCPVKCEPAVGKIQVGPAATIHGSGSLGENTCARMVSPKAVLRLVWSGPVGYGTLW